MKRIISLLMFCLCLIVVGSLLSVSSNAQQKSSDNNKKKKRTQKKTGENLQRMNTNQEQTNAPIRSEQQLEIIQLLIEQARTHGSATAIVGLRDFSAQDEILQQLAPFQVRLRTRYHVIPFLTLEVNEAALIFLRDSPLVTSIGRNLAARTAGGQTAPPARSPEQLKIFQQLGEQAAASGTIRVIIEVRASFTPV